MKESRFREVSDWPGVTQTEQRWPPVEAANLWLQKGSQPVPGRTGWARGYQLGELGHSKGAVACPAPI